MRPDAGRVRSVKPTIQRAVGGNVGWVDLELDVRGRQRTVIWVEIKLGHKLSGDNQLRKYGRRLLDLYPEAERFVLLLGPSQRREVFADIPPVSRRAAPEDH